MEYTPDELTSMATALCATYNGTTLSHAKALVLSGVVENAVLWHMMAHVAFTHMDYVKHDRTVTMMDAEMGLG